jgi:hypothetical protein
MERKVKRKDVIYLASELNIAVRRGHYADKYDDKSEFIPSAHGRWWFLSAHNNWCPFAFTNLRACQYLEEIEKERKNQK